ncbi:hypothetical protein [Bacteroides thetaiotaomicron]|uniref:hypothetical protein n=1 Tax=Bacteroides thetaiotaomicron TaxID=818 RepID=UPI003567B878
MLHVIPAKIFLSRGWLAVDDNGDLISLLDTDIDRKLALIEDISLYFALQQTKLPDSNIMVDILTEMPRSRKWTF